VTRADPWLREAAREVACVSSMVVPIAARGRILGAFVLASSNPARLYGESDLAMAEELGRRAGVAVDNARLYRDAREADRLKDEFLAILSHELRNPLTPIITALEMMQLRDSEAFARERDIISRNVHHVVRLVGDLLDVARITHGKITLQMARCDIARVIAKAEEMTAPLIAERGHALSIAPGDGSLAVIGDEARLAQTVANLLTNAAKYTDPGGQIAVTAAAEDDAVVIRVRDSGAGIPTQLIGKIFDPFVQNERTLDRAQGGLGIGLTVVRSIVALHNGEVTVHSDGPGTGSEFTIRLPRAPAELAAPAPSTPSATATVTRGRLSRLRVLVVDDNPDVTEVMQDALGALDCMSEVAHDGASALAMAASFLPDVAIVDIGMPGMDGYELARRLRDLFSARGAWIVALTGYGQEADRARAREAGFDDHIVKPVMLTTLRELIHSCRTALAARQD
jgi:signal transduction histidine kinase/ActR/RegA family two-component response regulator